MTTITQAIEEARKELLERGTIVPSPHGGNRRVIYGHKLEIDEFSERRYPYWSQKEDEWYQNIFVRKETTKPPEQDQGTILFPYTYAHRARYNDGGLGYLTTFAQTIKPEEGIQTTSKTRLIQYLKETIKHTHIENILAILSSKRIARFLNEQIFINEFQTDHEMLHNLLKSRRVDLLEQIITELQQDPNSSRAITASFIYPDTDFALGKAGGIPPYQNYQLFIEGGKLISIHQHRSLDINGGVQLDFNHDIDWGQYASQKLGIPLGRIIIIANNLHAYEGDQHLSEKTTIKNWLLKVTYGYDTSQIKPEEILKKYEKQIEQAWRAQQ